MKNKRTRIIVTEILVGLTEPDHNDELGTRFHLSLIVGKSAWFTHTGTVEGSPADLRRAVDIALVSLKSYLDSEGAVTVPANVSITNAHRTHENVMLSCIALPEITLADFRRKLRAKLFPHAN